MKQSWIEEMREVVALQRKWKAEDEARKGEQAVQRLREKALADHDEELLEELNASFHFDVLAWMTVTYRKQAWTVSYIPTRPQLADWMDQVDELLAMPRLVRPIAAWLKQRRERCESTS